MAAVTSQATFATLTLTDPHKVVAPGAQSIWFAGTILIHEDNPGPVLWVPHAYLETIGNHKLDVNSYAQSYYDWLGSGAAFTAGSSYTGDLFELVVEATDPAGLYNERFGNSALSTAWVYELGMNDPEHRSNEAPFSVRIVPEPATMATLGFGAIALLRRRRK